MTIQLNLPPELEHAARLQAVAIGEDVESFLLRQLAITLEQQQRSSVKPTDGVVPRSMQEEFRVRLRNVLAIHPKSSHFVDDSRESIYAGCGE